MSETLLLRIAALLEMIVQERLTQEYVKREAKELLDEIGATMQAQNSNHVSRT